MTAQADPHLWFAQPDGEPQRLDLAPRLASWDRSDHPDQIRLAAFLTATERQIHPMIDTVAGPLALRLDVGLPSSKSLLDQHDLDNYLFPLAKQLATGTQGRLVSVWATKSRNDTSFIRIQRAIPIETRPPSECFYAVRTSTSAQTTAFKQQINDQIPNTAELPEGPVSLQISFTVGSRRNWLNLWKPTIDALDPILGRTQPDRLWHPRDGRIVDLGLHLAADPRLNHEVIIAIAGNTHRGWSGGLVGDDAARTSLREWRPSGARSRAINLEPIRTSALPERYRIGEVPYAVVDVETTGLDPLCDRIVEIAIIRLNPDGTTQRTFTTLVQGDQGPGPTDIHGINAADLMGAPLFMEVAGDIARIIEGAVVVAHNALYDTSMLIAEFARAGTTPDELLALCTLQLAKRCGLPGR